MSDHEALTLPVARQVFMLSYYFSQGSPKFQDDLIRYLALLRPGWRLSDQDCAALQGLLHSILALPKRGVHQPYHHSVAEIKQDIWDERLTLWRAFQATRIPGSEQAREQLAPRLMDWFIERDWRFLVEIGERTRAARKRAMVSPRCDPHLSFFCHYILLPYHSAGSPVYDELLTDVAEEVTRHGGVAGLLADPLRQKRVAEVLDQHNRWHPLTPITLAHPCPPKEE
jgi:hypothetical protein